MGRWPPHRPGGYPSGMTLLGTLSQDPLLLCPSGRILSFNLKDRDQASFHDLWSRPGFPKLYKKLFLAKFPISHMCEVETSLCQKYTSPNPSQTVSVIRLWREDTGIRAGIRRRTQGKNALLIGLYGSGSGDYTKHIWKGILRQSKDDENFTLVLPQMDRLWMFKLSYLSDLTPISIHPLSSGTHAPVSSWGTLLSVHEISVQPTLPPTQGEA